MVAIRKKRKYDLGRPSAMTKLGAKRIHLVRTMGGNQKHRALRLETGNFSWGSEVNTRKTRILNVVYNSSSNELVRTNTLVKNCIVQVDATPFRQWYESHYGIPLGRKKGTEVAEDDQLNKARSRHVAAKVAGRKEASKLENSFESQFAAGRLYACIASRPGQSGRADGYLLEGKELDFYLKKLKSKHH